MGTVWKGSGLTLEKNALAMAPVPDPKVFTSKELAAIKIAKNVCTFFSAICTTFNNSSRRVCL